MGKISVCILARNAADYIERALLCSRGCGDVIVMDHGSTDNTVEIVNKYTNKIIHYDADREMDFSYAQNRMAWAADNDIVFKLDSDEFVNPLLFNFLEANINALTGAAAALPLCESYVPGFCDPVLLSQMKPRIYDRRYGYWSGRLHETLRGPCLKRMNMVPFYLWHRAFKMDDDALWQKIQYYNERMSRIDPIYNDKNYWAQEYVAIYGRQKPVPSAVEAQFVKEFFDAHPWKIEGVV